MKTTLQHKHDRPEVAAGTSGVEVPRTLLVILLLLVLMGCASQGSNRRASSLSSQANSDTGRSWIGWEVRGSTDEELCAEMRAYLMVAPATQSRDDDVIIADEMREFAERATNPGLRDAFLNDAINWEGHVRDWAGGSWDYC